ncbi:MAG: hypothetical protein LBT58_04220 [Endomicrobium sp.]|jgi:predicted NBD/HSP70 family sugar kinase|nr:hypothetical protein [Endomicrobium sp.]
MSKDLYLGVDMGGTQIKVAVVTSKGVIKEEIAMPSDVNAKSSNVLNSVVYLASKLKNYPKTKIMNFSNPDTVVFCGGLSRAASK